MHTVTRKLKSKFMKIPYIYTGRKNCFLQTVPDRWFTYDDLNQKQQKKSKIKFTAKSLIHTQVLECDEHPWIKELNFPFKKVK